MQNALPVSIYNEYPGSIILLYVILIFGDFIIVGQMSLPIFFVNVSKVVITLVKVTFSSFKYCFELVKRIFHLKVLVFLAILNTG